MDWMKKLLLFGGLKWLQRRLGYLSLHSMTVDKHSLNNSQTIKGHTIDPINELQY